MNYFLPIVIIFMTFVAFAGDEDVAIGRCFLDYPPADYFESQQALQEKPSSDLALHRIYMDEDTPPELVPPAPQFDTDLQQKLMKLRLTVGRVFAVFVSGDEQIQMCRGTGIWISSDRVLITKEVGAPKRTYNGQPWILSEISIVTRNNVSRERGAVQLNLPNEENHTSELSDFFVLTPKSGQQKFFAQLEPLSKDSPPEEKRSCALIGFPFPLQLAQYLAREKNKSEENFREIEAATGCFMERIISFGTYQYVSDKLSHDCFSWPGMSGALLVDLEKLKNAEHPVFHGVVCTLLPNEGTNAAVPHVSQRP